MKLALSNLAIPNTVGTDVYERLRLAGVAGIEVAPTRIAMWEELSHSKLADFRSVLTGSGLEVSSLQAILFGAPDLALLESEERFQSLADHMERVADIAATLECSVAVFGSPKQRARGELSESDAFKLGTERFTKLAGIMHEKGAVIGLEPVPAAYGGTFLETWQDVRNMVEVVGHPGLRVHLDTGCVLLGNGNITQAIKASSDLLAHFHIAEPKLAAFGEPVAEHDAAAKALDSIGYSGWAAIEMLEFGDQPIDAAMKAVRFARSRYFDA